MGDVVQVRSVVLVPTGAMGAAARYVEGEYGESGYRLGYAGPVEFGGRSFYVFQVAASDGSRFLVWANTWEAGSFTREQELGYAAQLNVEVS